MSVKNIDVYRHVMNDTDEPILVHTAGEWKLVIGALSDLVDGEFTDPMVYIAGDATAAYIWFHAEEADVVWRAGEGDDHSVVNSMPYEKKPMVLSELLDSALGWESAAVINDG